MALKFFDFMPFGARNAERRLRCPKPRRVVRSRSRRARARAFFVALAIVSLAGGGVAGGLWYFGIASAVADSAPLASENLRPFGIHGIQLGMTSNAVRALHPRITMQWQRDGSHLGEFVKSGIAHRVWFAPGWKPGVVYRISYRQVFPLMTPEGVHDRFDWQFGTPDSVNCETLQSGQDQGFCTYKWETRQGVAVEVRSRDVMTPSGDSLTVLTVTATDIDTAKQVSVSQPIAGRS